MKINNENNYYKSKNSKKTKKIKLKQIKVKYKDKRKS